MQGHKDRIRLHLLPYFGKKSVSQITSGVVQQYRMHRMTEGKVQLIDASGDRFYKSMRKNLGSKRREIPDEAREEIVRIYAGFCSARSGRDGPRPGSDHRPG